MVTIVFRGLKILEQDPIAKKVFALPQNSLILGTSRAALLDGTLITEAMNKEDILFDSVFNFAFNLGASPYGPSYTDHIKRKLIKAPDEKQRVFILCIDPWALSAAKSRPNDSLPFYESNTFITFNTNQKWAKLKYFRSYFPQPYYTLFLPQKKNRNHLERPTKDHIQKHLKGKIEAYKTFNAVNNKLSKARIAHLDTLIQYLNKMGEVYLIKLPIAQEMIDLEKWYAPTFNDEIKALKKKHGISLIDFYPYTNQFLCPDGNHLFYEDARVVSQIIGDIIRLKSAASMTEHSSNLLENFILYKKDSVLNPMKGMQSNFHEQKQ